MKNVISVVLSGLLGILLLVGLPAHADSLDTSTNEAIVELQDMEVESKRKLAKRFREDGINTISGAMASIQNYGKVGGEKVLFQSRTKSFDEMLKSCERSIKVYSDSNGNLDKFKKVRNSCDDRKIYGSWFAIMEHYLELFIESNPEKDPPYRCETTAGSHQYNCY